MAAIAKPTGQSSMLDTSINAPGGPSGVDSSATRKEKDRQRSGAPSSGGGFGAGPVVDRLSLVLGVPADGTSVRGDFGRVPNPKHHAFRAMISSVRQ